MAIKQFLDDLNIIAKLGDNPGTDNGLSTNAFRAKFDEGSLKIQKYINEVLIPAMSALASPENGLTMRANLDMNGYKLLNIGTPTSEKHAATKGYVDGKTQTQTIMLLPSGWIDGMQTVNVSGVTATNDVDVSPSAASYTEYCDAGVRCVNQGLDTLIFECDTVPSVDLIVNLRIWN